MRAPLTWLRDYAPLEAEVDRLATTLSELGLVVEGIEHVGGGLGDVIVSRILDIKAHPNADRVRLVDVDAGRGDPLQIVCGAWNFAAGDLVPLAPVGATLPGEVSISRAKMRGEWSNGMLCSPEELGLPVPAGTDDGLMILPAGLAPPGTPLVDALGLVPDVVFDLDISPNRSDALNMAGVARDLAAALGEPWALPVFERVPVDESLGRAPVIVEAGDLCPRFTATILEGVPEGPSPAWIARRLALAGMRPINAVVDVSNYVMLDVGQPNHPYDLERLGGQGILVRRGKAGEVLETLDGVERHLEENDCVICDANSTPVGVGGIMGGASAEIGPDTRRVLLEAAWFTPMAIARTGKRLGLHSEARVRFERGVDPQIAPLAVERFISLLAALDGGAALRRGPVVDVQDADSMPPPARVSVRTARVNAILGTGLADSEVAALIEPIGFEATPSEPGVHEVDIPSWRLECNREIDIIEEVARMWGYSRIERTIPPGAGSRAGGLTAHQRERRLIRRVLADAGFDEAWTTTFLAPGDLERAGLSPDAVEVENPLDQSESILRTALLPGLLKAVKFNVDRQANEVSLFEIGNVFALPREGSGRATPDESEHLAVIVNLGEQAAGASSAPEVEAVVRALTWLAEALRLEGVNLLPFQVPSLHPTRGANLVGLRGDPIGHVGEVDPSVSAAFGIESRVGYLTVSLDAVAAQPRRPRRARDVSRYPAADVDLAFVVRDDIPAGAVYETLHSAGGEVLEGLTLFDVYRGLGPGQRSLAFRLRFRAADRTLDESELARIRQEAIDAVVERHGAELRT
jgi:phenylalanyl-tRNA synthetase beta chain